MIFNRLLLVLFNTINHMGNASHSWGMTKLLPLLKYGESLCKQFLSWRLESSGMLCHWVNISQCLEDSWCLQLQGLVVHDEKPCKKDILLEPLDHENKGSMIIQNVCKYLLSDKVSQCRRLKLQQHCSSNQTMPSMLGNSPLFNYCTVFRITVKTHTVQCRCLLTGTLVFHKARMHRYIKWEKQCKSVYT